MQESQDSGDNQLTEWMWGRKEVSTYRNDEEALVTYDFMVLVRWERTGSVLAQRPGEMVSTLFPLRGSFKNLMR